MIMRRPLPPATTRSGPRSTPAVLARTGAGGGVGWTIHLPAGNTQFGSCLVDRCHPTATPALASIVRTLGQAPDDLSLPQHPIPPRGGIGCCGKLRSSGAWPSVRTMLASAGVAVGWQRSTRQLPNWVFPAGRCIVQPTPPPAPVRASTAGVDRGPERVVAGGSGRRMIIGGCEDNEDFCVGRGS